MIIPRSRYVPVGHNFVLYCVFGGSGNLSSSQGILVLDSHLAFDVGKARIGAQRVVANIEPK